jgi:uncharacterized membrane protein YsdA (DUF1294 family)
MEKNIFILCLVYAIINLIGFILVGVDKKRSVNHSDRVPEVYLFFISIFFASFGVLLGMYFFHHKTKKFYFPFGISLLLIEQLALIILLKNLINL